MRRVSLLLFLLLTSALHAEEKAPADGGLLGVVDDKKIPIEITAQRLEAGMTKARFDEKVVVTRGEVTLTCQHLEAEYDASNHELTGLRAWGGVRILHRDSLATGSEAIYKRESDQAELTGDPVIYQGENSIRGLKIIFHFSKSVFEVIQPKAEFTPPEKKGGAGP